MRKAIIALLVAIALLVVFWFRLSPARQTQTGEQFQADAETPNESDVQIELATNDSTAEALPDLQEALGNDQTAPSAGNHANQYAPRNPAVDTGPLQLTNALIFIPVDKDISIPLVYLPPGQFRLGDASENDGSGEQVNPTRKLPKKDIELTYDFWMGKYEVTVGEFEAMGVYSPFREADKRKPITKVSAEDGMEFCKRLSDLHRDSGLLEGYEFRLPTEAEWEYSNLGGWSGIENIETTWTNYAVLQPFWTGELPVDGRQPNRWGIHDMIGNAAEWCVDVLSQQGDAISAINPVGRLVIPRHHGKLHVMRGGSWQNNFEPSGYGRRHVALSSKSIIGVGFRIVLAPRIDLLIQNQSAQGQ